MGRDRSRISRRRGRQLSRGGANIRFCQTFQKMEKISGTVGGGGGGALDPPLLGTEKGAIYLPQSLSFLVELKLGIRPAALHSM